MVAPSLAPVLSWPGYPLPMGMIRGPGSVSSMPTWALAMTVAAMSD
jgi:hypothetical protein